MSCWFLLECFIGKCKFMVCSETKQFSLQRHYSNYNVQSTRLRLLHTRRKFSEHHSDRDTDEQRILSAQPLCWWATAASDATAGESWGGGVTWLMAVLLKQRQHSELQLETDVAGHCSWLLRVTFWRPLSLKQTADYGTQRSRTVIKWRDVGCSLHGSLLFHRLARARCEGGDLMR